jgi:DNA polymerase-3 subunit alpha
VQGQARNDAFTGGIRFTVDTVMDLARARSRFAQAVKVSMNGNADAIALRRVLEAHCAAVNAAAAEPAAIAAPTAGRGAARGGADAGRQRNATPVPNGLAVQIAYSNAHAQGEMRLSDAWRVRPTDELLADLRNEFATAVEIVY